MLILNNVNHKKEILYLEKNYQSKCDYNLDSDSFQYLSFIENGLLKGYIIFSHTINEVEIYSIYVKDEYRKNKVATNMLEYITNKFNNCIFYLEVSSINHPAIDLYKKFQFKEYNIRKNYYKDNSDAFLLKREVNIC